MSEFAPEHIPTSTRPDGRSATLLVLPCHDPREAPGAPSQRAAWDSLQVALDGFTATHSRGDAYSVGQTHEAGFRPPRAGHSEGKGSVR